MSNKRKQKPAASNPKKKRRQSGGLDDELIFLEESDNDSASSRPDSEDDEFEEETPDEKRIRLAKMYLKKLETEITEDGGGIVSDSDEEMELKDTSDLINERLQRDALKKTGKLHRNIADAVGQRLNQQPPKVDILRGHKLPVVCAVISEDEKIAYSASKDGSIFKWDLTTRKKLHHFKKARNKDEEGHTTLILSIALSSDQTLLASAGNDKKILIWDTKTHKLLKSFTGHRKEISSLVFQKGTKTLYSASNDRTVKIWNCENLTYLDTLYGPEHDITSIDCLTAERVLAAGGDCIVRLFKVGDGSQAIFRGHNASIDCCCFINSQKFLCGSQDGSVSLWLHTKKRAAWIVNDAHDGKWITAVASQNYTDLIASGSSNGVIQFWKCAENNKFERLCTVKLVGFINSLQFSKSGKYLVAAVGQEHRLGRWEKIQQARNAIHVIHLKTLPTP